MVRPLLAALVLCVLVAGTAGRESPSSPSRQTFGTGASAVVVDAVVRDGKGHPVTDLRKEDFELFEDGVKQEIGDVTMPASVGVVTATARRSSASTESSVGAAPGDNRTAAPRFMALVFDRLSTDARASACQGALASLGTLQVNDFVAVYLSDLKLTTIQGYTNDRAKVQAALMSVARRATSVFDRSATKGDLKERDDRGNPLPGDVDPSVPYVAGAESVGRPVDIRNIGARELLWLQESTRNSWDLMARDQQGYATTNALLAVTTALGTMPGRKSVVFFAEGLAIPVAVLPHFKRVIATANRGNVSVYTVDAAGLRVHSKDEEISREVNLMANASANGGGSMAMLERNEDVLRKDPRTSLTLLAKDTGGFLIENSNDLANGFRQIDADRRFYYLLTYTPRNSDFDGKWRSVSVQVPRRKVTIRARSGYVAARGPATPPPDRQPE